MGETWLGDKDWWNEADKVEGAKATWIRADHNGSPLYPNSKLFEQFLLFFPHRSGEESWRVDGMLIYLSTDDVKRRTFIEGDGGHWCFPSSRPGHAFNTLKEYDHFSAFNVYFSEGFCVTIWRSIRWPTHSLWAIDCIPPMAGPSVEGWRWVGKIRRPGIPLGLICLFLVCCIFSQPSGFLGPGPISRNDKPLKSSGTSHQLWVSTCHWGLCVLGWRMVVPRVLKAFSWRSHRLVMAMGSLVQSGGWMIVNRMVNEWMPMMTVHVLHRNGDSCHFVMLLPCSCRAFVQLRKCPTNVVKCRNTVCSSNPFKKQLFYFQAAGTARFLPERDGGNNSKDALPSSEGCGLCWPWIGGREGCSCTAARETPRQGVQIQGASAERIYGIIILIMY